MSDRLRIFQASEQTQEAGGPSLPELAQLSPVAAHRALQGHMLSCEADEIYQAACAMRDQATLYEKKLLTRASPMLANAVNLGIRQLAASQSDYESQFGGRAGQYTTPGSVSSMFSPAAYLTELYRAARTLYPEGDRFHIDQRRPDLQNLSLSQVNQNESVSALSLSSEVLMTHARSKLNVSADHDVLQHLTTWRTSGEAPYHDAFTRVWQCRVQKDPVFRHFDASAQVVSSFSAPLMAGLANGISPESYRILTEEVTEETAESLYKANFGDILPQALLEPQALSNYYGLTYDEVKSFISGENDTYMNGVLTTRLGDKLLRLESTLPESSTLDFAHLYPQPDGSYKLSLNYAGLTGEADQFEVRLDSENGKVLYEQDNLTLVQGMTLNFPLPVGSIPAEGTVKLVLVRLKSDQPVERVSVDHALTSPSPYAWLLRLNQVIRLSAATNLGPADLAALRQSAGNAHLTDTTLTLLQNTQLAMQRYKLAFNDALVLSGGLISVSSPASGASHFDRVFNTPPLDGRLFASSKTALSMKPEDAHLHPFEKMVLKRALGVDDAGLYALTRLYDAQNEDARLYVSLSNLSRLYALSLLAQVHGLSVNELVLLQTVWGDDWLDNPDKAKRMLFTGQVAELTNWLKKQSWQVADLWLMTRSTYDTAATSEIKALLTTLHQVVVDNSTISKTPVEKPVPLEELIAQLAPALAPVLMLPSADVAASLLTWANTVKPGGSDIKAFWNALKEKEVEEDNFPESTVTFCYGLAQLALIYHGSKISADAFQLFVKTPSRLLLELESSSPLPRDITTLQGLCNFTHWLNGLGDSAALVLRALDAGKLPASLLARALELSEATVVQAIKQVSDNEYLVSWSETESMLQWLSLSVAFGVTPNDLQLLQEADYAEASSYADWTALASRFQAGLSAYQTTALETVCSTRLSAALSSYVLQHAIPFLVSPYSREGLYQYLLLDNLNGPQVITSRLAEAITSIQTFIQRTLSNPEGEVEDSAFSSPFMTGWAMYNQRYSTWTGAQKLVYYPENYVDPTVRLGQTPMMNEMLQKLGQGQLNDDTVEDAFHSYLSSFEEVANLQVISAYHDHLDIHDEKTWFIGQSQTEPRTFHWRNVNQQLRNEDGKFPANAWSAWQQITCAPQPWGNLIRPVVYKTRLYLCWVERQDITPPNKDGYPKPDNEKVWSYHLKLAYQRYDGSWSTPKSIDVTNSKPGSPQTNLGLYCSSYQNEETLLVMLYDKGNHADVQAWNIYQDMSWEVRPNGSSIALEITYELDSPSRIAVNNPYTPVEVLNEKQLRPSDKKHNDRYTLTGASDSIDVAMEGQSIKLSLSAKLTAKITRTEEPPSIRELKKIYPEINNGAGGELFVNESPSKIHSTTIIRTANKFYSITTEGEILNTISLAIKYKNLPTFSDLDPEELKRQTIAGIHYIIARFPDLHPGVELEKYAFHPNFTRHARFNFFSNQDRWYDGSFFGNFSPSQHLKTNVPKDKISVTVNDGITQTTFPAQSGLDFTLLDIQNTSINVPNFLVTTDWKGKSELLLDVTFKVLDEYTTYQLRLYKSLQGMTNVILLKTIANNAQYMQHGPYRTRLNTLFARKLVERASTGISTILSYETQQLDEPTLGMGSYINVEFPSYNPEEHGNSRDVSLLLNSVENADHDKIKDDPHTFWSGTLTDSGQIVRIFVTYNFANKDYIEFPISRTLRICMNYEAGPQSVGYLYSPNNDGVYNFTKSEDWKKTRDPDVTRYNGNDQMDFAGANALYFWELFYYAPAMVARRLLQEQQFAQADQWLRYVWNPTGYSEQGNRTERYWNVRPLEEDTSWNSTPLITRDPDAVAQNDPMHYKLTTFMQTLDLLIARGDAAYRRLERDTLAEAKVWYSQALNLLGDEPYIEDNPSWSAPTLSEMVSPSNALRRMTALTQMSGMLPPSDSIPALLSGTPPLAFLPEANDIMLDYWLSLRLRMHNLRHNLTLDGQPLMLPLYSTPVDPKALLNAAVSAANGSGPELPPINFIPLQRVEPLLDSARSLVSQLIQFGNAVLSVSERQDAESLNLLLQTQGVNLIAGSLRLHESTLRELDAEKATLTRIKQTAAGRFNHYAKLYDENISANEKGSLDLMLLAGIQTIATAPVKVTAGITKAVPRIFGMAVGGQELAGPIEAAVAISNTITDIMKLSASNMIQHEAWRRRRQDWEIQRDNAKGEMHQIDAQLDALAARRESALMQKTQLLQQQTNTQTHLAFLQKKFSNASLYTWLRGRLSAIFFQFYDIAITRCLMAESAMRWVRGDQSLQYIRPGAWQGTQSGLMCGETLMLNLAQMEAAWVTGITRALEVTRTVSLAQFYNELGEGFHFTLADGIPEVLAGGGKKGSENNFIQLSNDMLEVTFTLADLNIRDDYPESSGKKRRIRQLSVSLPALLGPYQDIQAELSSDQIQKLPPGCNRMVISRGMHDDGLHQPGLNDSRWLPFEGLGIDEGILTLRFPNATGNQKALLESLSDIILHVNYTIRA